MSTEEKEPKTVELESVPVVSSQALEAMERAQISELVATAKNYPRKIKLCLEKAISRATVSQEIAEKCHYWLPRSEDGEQKWITGPSIKLAQIMAQSWGNCRQATMIVGTEGDFIKTRAYFYDCEENHLAVEEISRAITGKRGRYGVNMIQTTGAAASSIALRNAILRVIPEEYVDKVGTAAKKVAYGDQKPMVERRQRVINRFAQVDIGVPKEDILRFLGRESVELITSEDLEKMHGVLTSIKEGLVKKEELFTKHAQPSVPKPNDPAPSEPAKEPVVDEVEAAKAQLAETQKRIKKAKSTEPEKGTLPF